MLIQHSTILYYPLHSLIPVYHGKKVQKCGLFILRKSILLDDAQSSDSMVASALAKVIPSNFSYCPSASSSGGALSSSYHSGLPMACIPKRSTQPQAGSTSFSHALSQAKMETNKGLKGKGRLASGQKKNVSFCLPSQQLILLTPPFRADQRTSNLRCHRSLFSLVE